ncbi:MAG: phosphoribosyl-ATP diphosphatase [Arenicellales bacterium]
MIGRESHRDVLEQLERLIRKRITQGCSDSYVVELVQDDNRVLKKIGEEAIELVLAAKTGDSGSICHESADLMFHLMVLLAQHEIAVDQVLKQLQNRMGVSGLQEKALRSTLKSG